MKAVHAIARLGSEWNGISSGEALMPTLMSRAYMLTFFVSSVPEFKDAAYRRASLCLEYFASLENIKVSIGCAARASDAEVKDVEASLYHAARVHRNHPAVEIYC